MSSLILWWIGLAALTTLLAPYDEVEEDIGNPLAPQGRPVAMIIVLFFCLVLWPFKLPGWAWKKWKKHRAG